MKKIFETAQLLIIAIIIPLIGRYDIVLTWPILTVILYGVFLSVSQPTMVFKKEAKSHDRHSMHAILLGGLLTFVIPICDYAYGKTKIVRLDQVVTIVGLAMIFGGFAFRYWAIRVLGRFFTSKVHIQEDHELVQDKPYQWLRHPSYTGAWVSALGISTFLQSRFGIVFCIFIYFPIYIYRIECEEKALKETFPQSYPQYQLKTSKMFPHLY